MSKKILPEKNQLKELLQQKLQSFQHEFYSGLATSGAPAEYVDRAAQTHAFIDEIRRIRTAIAKLCADPESTVNC